MEHKGGAFDWSQSRNSRFETSRSTPMDFTRIRSLERPPSTLRGTVIRPSSTHRFLSILLVNKLRWKAAYVSANRVTYVNLPHRPANILKRISSRLMRLLYHLAAVPKATNAFNVWIRPPFDLGTGKPLAGSFRASQGSSDRPMSRSQELLATRQSILEAHENLPPTEIYCRVMLRSIIRMAAPAPMSYHQTGCTKIQVNLPSIISFTAFTSIRTLPKKRRFSRGELPPFTTSIAGD